MLDTRRADGPMNRDAVITHRQYLLDALFGIILHGDRGVLEPRSRRTARPGLGGVAWPQELYPRGSGVRRTGRIARAGVASNTGRVRAKCRDTLRTFTMVTEVQEFADGTDSLNDQPVSFGDGTSSGPDKRQFASRRIAVKPGIRRP